MSNPKLRRHVGQIVTALPQCVHGKVLSCFICRPPSDEMLELARRGIARMTANTAQVQGNPCPCGGGAAVFRGQIGRFWCAKCDESARAAALAFVMDESFGGP